MESSKIRNLPDRQNGQITLIWKPNLSVKRRKQEKTSETMSGKTSTRKTAKFPERLDALHFRLDLSIFQPRKQQIGRSRKIGNLDTSKKPENVSPERAEKVVEASVVKESAENGVQQLHDVRIRQFSNFLQSPGTSQSGTPSKEPRNAAGLALRPCGH